MTPRSEFLAGVRAELPILFGTIPFGLIYGVLAVGAGLPVAAALGMSSIVFAGSAQFIGMQLISAGAPGLLVILTTFVVNLRHVLYSASVAPHIKHLSPAWKWLLAYLLTDEAFAVTIVHYDQKTDPTYKHWFFLGSGLALWSTWQASTAAGVFLGASVPASWSLDFTLTVTFIAIVIPALRDRAALASALSAGVVAVLAAGLPLKLGLMVAALTGILIGVVIENGVVNGK
ncbi:MAG: AzlC family ABC transporter permease [Anaerolineales bacterium]